MYLVDGRSYEADESGLELALAAAHDQRIRPLCLCCDPPLPVYITRLGETFVLKRMPFTGSQHAVGCTHYEPPPELSGLCQILGTAISESPETGITQLRVNFSLFKGVPRTVLSPESVDSGGTRSHGARLSLRGLVHYLWNDAELTRWRPGFEGKRSWAVVRSHLLTAASNKVVKGSPLADVIYVPEPFAVCGAEAIRTRRTVRFDRAMKRSSQCLPRKMLLIGELKEVLSARLHFSIIVKHVPDVPFFLHSDLHRRMIRQFESELALWAGNPECHLIVAATISLTHWGQPAIDEICLITMSAQWIPAADGYEKLLVDRLVRERRTFDKCLTFNSKLSQTSISAVLLDAGSAPIPLALERQSGVDRISGYGTGPDMGGWRWNIYESAMPALPR